VALGGAAVAEEFATALRSAGSVRQTKTRRFLVHLEVVTILANAFVVPSVHVGCEVVGGLLKIG